MRSTWFLALLLWLLPAVAVAKDASVSVSLESDVVEVARNFRYVVTASVQGDERIRFIRSPDFGGLKRVGQRRMPQLINVNGVTTRRLSVSYTLRAHERGSFTIQPPTVQIGSQRLKPKTVSVEAVGRGEAPKNHTRGNRRYFLEVGVDPEHEPYVGEQLTLRWDLFVDGTRFDVRPTSTRDPSLDEFWVEPIPTNDNDRIVTYDGRLMRQIPLWRYAAFALDSGPVTIEPVDVEVVVGTFTRRKTTVVESDPIEINVKPLPPDAPSSFVEGNVGILNFDVRTDQNLTRVGRPITVDVTVSGQAHLARIEVPELPEIPRVRVSDVDEETKNRVRNGRVGGRKTVSYTLTPLEEGPVTIPAMEFAYFDTRQREYVVRKSKPVTFKVLVGKAPADPVEPEKLPTRNVSGGEDLVQNLIDQLSPPRTDPSLEASGDPARFPWLYWVLGALSFLGFLGVLFRPRWEQMRKERQPERKRKTATRQVFELLDEAGDDPQAIYAALRDWLSSAFDIPRGAVTANDLPRAFEKRGLDSEVAERLADVLARCEEARFAPDGADTTSLANDAREVAQWLRDSGGTDGVTAVSVILAILLVSTTAFAIPGLEGALEAQQNENWAAASAQWRTVAEEHPDAVDVWYNLGTTAAHAGDWATARHALERAAYLAPLDSDVSTNRDIVARIVRLHAIERSRTGRTMDGDEMLFWWDIAAHVSPHIAGVLLFLFWLVAAGLVILRRRTNSAAIRDAAFVGLLLAVLLAVLSSMAVAARAQLMSDADPVVLVTDELELREGPNDAAKLKRIPTTLVPGTLLRATARRDGWVKLTWHDDAGWTRTDAVARVRR